MPVWTRKTKRPTELGPWIGLRKRGGHTVVVAPSPSNALKRTWEMRRPYRCCCALSNALKPVHLSLILIWGTAAQAPYKPCGPFVNI
jgi:hypothetical protein